MVRLNKNNGIHHAELKKSRITKDEAAVIAVIETIENWNKSFDGPQEIVSLSTARSVPPEISADLLKAKEVGESVYMAFWQDRLETDSPKS